MYPGSTEMQYVFQAKKVQTNYILLARGTILCTCRVPPPLHSSECRRIKHVILYSV